MHSQDDGRLGHQIFMKDPIKLVTHWMRSNPIKGSTVIWFRISKKLKGYELHGKTKIEHVFSGQWLPAGLSLCPLRSPSYRFRLLWSRSLSWRRFLQDVRESDPDAVLCHDQQTDMCSVLLKKRHSEEGDVLCLYVISGYNLSSICFVFSSFVILLSSIVFFSSLYDYIRDTRYRLSSESEEVFGGGLCSDWLDEWSFRSKGSTGLVGVVEHNLSVPREPSRIHQKSRRHPDHHFHLGRWSECCITSQILWFIKSHNFPHLLLSRQKSSRRTNEFIADKFCTFQSCSNLHVLVHVRSHFDLHFHEGNRSFWEEVFGLFSGETVGGSAEKTADMDDILFSPLDKVCSLKSDTHDNCDFGLSETCFRFQIDECTYGFYRILRRVWETHPRAVRCTDWMWELGNIIAVRVDCRFDGVSDRLVHLLEGHHPYQQFRKSRRNVLPARLAPRCRLPVHFDSPRFHDHLLLFGNVWWVRWEVFWIFSRFQAWFFALLPVLLTPDWFSHSFPCTLNWILPSRGTISMMTSCGSLVVFCCCLQTRWRTDWNYFVETVESADLLHDRDDDWCLPGRIHWKQEGAASDCDGDRLDRRDLPWGMLHYVWKHWNKVRIDF